MSRRVVVSFVALLCIASCKPASSVPDGGDARGTLGLNEVSILLPLPRSEAERAVMLKPTDEGALGAFAPDFALPGPALVMNEERQTSLTNLRVVSLRTSPCDPFIGETNLANCQRVLHVVLQPVSASGPGFTTADATVHLMYRLDTEQWERWLQALLDLATAHPVAPGEPLQVHPALLSEGLTGDTWKQIHTAVLSVAGARNLERMAYASLRATTSSTLFGKGWLFSGAEFKGGAQHRATVATTQDSEQHFGNNANTTASAGDETTFLGDFIPRTSASDRLLSIVADSTVAKSAPLSDLQGAVDEAVALENPMKFTLDSADCASCHVAGVARTWAERERGVTAEGNPQRYQNAAFNLTNSSSAQRLTNSLRGLGYYGAALAISQRTINDTAADATFINTNELSAGSLVHRELPGHLESDGGTPSGWTREAPLALPMGTTSLGVLATDEAHHRLFVGAGARVLAFDLTAPAPVSTIFADLSAQGLTSIDAMTVLSAGGVMCVGHQTAVFLGTDGHVVTTIALGAPGFQAAWSASSNGAVVVALESGGGSADPDGVTRAHVAWWDLTQPAPVMPTTFALASPFHLAPPEVGAVNASAPLLSDDGSRVLFFHVIYRAAFSLELATRTITSIAEDSLYRSVNAVALSRSGVLVQAASFDQTVPVYKWAGVGSMRSLVELPLGLNEGALATDGERVFVALGGSAGGFPPLPADGGFPGFPGGLDGGFPGFPGGLDGGFPGFPGMGGGAVSLEVFRLSPELVR